MSFHRFQNLLSSQALRAVAVLAVAVAGVASSPAASAQSGVQSAAQSSAQSASQPQSSLQFPVPDTSTQLFSSSSDQNAQNAPAASTTTEASLNPASGTNFANYMQYGGGQRRRYGKPTYRGNNTTADGTPKYTGEFGAGFTQPIGNTWKYLTPSYTIGGGFGRNFNRQLGLLLQVDYDHFGFTGNTLNDQSGLYFSGDTNPNDNGLDGTSHIWSVSLNPVYTIASGSSGGFGLYAVGGVGFYHKVANFTIPQQQTYCDPYYGCQLIYANGTFDHYSSNAPGFSGGFGVTYKISRFANERFFMEARYVFIDNSHRNGYVYSASAVNTNYGVPTGPGAAPYNLYPANSNRTAYIPIKFGIRF